MEFSSFLLFLKCKKLRQTKYELIDWHRRYSHQNEEKNWTRLAFNRRLRKTSRECLIRFIWNNNNNCFSDRFETTCVNTWAAAAAVAWYFTVWVSKAHTWNCLFTAHWWRLLDLPSSCHIFIPYVSFFIRIFQHSNDARAFFGSILKWKRRRINWHTALFLADVVFFRSPQWVLSGLQAWLYWSKVVNNISQSLFFV